jgi:pyridoxal phosphate enzyme (YggS family)
MLKDKILGIRERIVSICSRINRDPESIAVVAVSKGRTVEQIKEVVAAGITDIGENRVQETLVKYNALQAASCRLQAIKWHMVGHLQTNKVKDAVKIFGLIQSVDSVHLAQEIDAHAVKIDKIQEILIEVKISPEASKFGIKPEVLVDAVKEISKFKNVRIKGLMTIAPTVDNPEKTRPYFTMLRELRDKINGLQLAACSLQLLSMGMTDDFEMAIEEGATMIRIGRAIFEG